MKTLIWRFVTKRDDPISAAIRWKTDSEISHVEARTDDGQYLGALLNGGVAIRPANYDTFTLQIIVSLPIQDSKANAFWNFLHSRVGEKYNVLGIIGITLGDNLTGTGHEFCSQLQADAIIQGTIFNIAKSTSKIDPETLRLLIMSQPGAVEQRIIG